MHLHPGPVVSLLLALTWADLSAQQACTLLSSAEIEAITGSKAREPQPTNMKIPSGTQAGQTVNGCMWGTADKGMVSISVMPMPTDPATRKAGMEKLDEVYAKLRARKWTQEEQKYPHGRCTTMTPPATEKSAPILSGCIADVHGMLVSSSYMSPTKKLPMDKSKALVDKIASHMH
ncbi:MAG TPA: hypothetical protein VIG08_06815 [Gemmatimonadales bacterium]|jgi:hypothetical protein